MSEKTQDSRLRSKEYRRNNYYKPTGVGSLWVIPPGDTRNFTRSPQETKMTNRTESANRLWAASGYLLCVLEPPATRPQSLGPSTEKNHSASFILICSFLTEGKAHRM